MLLRQPGHQYLNKMPSNTPTIQGTPFYLIFKTFSNLTVKNIKF